MHAPGPRPAARSPMFVPRAAALLVCLAVLGGCGKSETPPPPPRPVVAMPAQPDAQAPRVTLPGQIEARYSTQLSFRVSGKIIERKVRLGDPVKAGQAVARLDPADATKNAAAAQAQASAARHQLEYARQQLDRDRAQAREQLIAASQLEQTQNAYASALAQRDSAVQQAALAKDQLNYTTLVADHAGVITAERADTGQNVAAGDPVYSLAWAGDVDVTVDVPENILAGLRIGQRATVTLPAAPGRTLQATLRELAPAADARTRTFRARYTLHDAGADARLGMTATVAIDQAQGGAATYTLPSTALFHDGADPAVWVVKAGEDVLELRRVTVQRFNERTVTVSAGIDKDERIVWQGVHTVSAGEKVRVVPPLHPEDFAS